MASRADTDDRVPRNGVLVAGGAISSTAASTTRAELARRYPVLAPMEKYAGGKRTRVIRTPDDDED